MIRVKDLTKCFDNKARVLDCTNMHVKKGSIYGLVGVNGSGKTTLIKHLLGIWKEDSGSIEIDGQKVYENNKVKENIAYVSDDLFFYNGYTLKEMAKQYASYYPNWSWEKYNEMIEKFNLIEKNKLNTFSKGMQKQAYFILAISTMPSVLLLDEPIDGLDPIVRKKVWSIIMNEVADREITVLVSSHNLREMEGVCDSIGIMKNGRIVIERDIDDLKTDIHKVQVAFKGDCYNAFENLNVIHTETRGSVYLMIIRNNMNTIRENLEKYNPLVLDVLPLSLEEIFIYELGGSEDEEIKL